MCRIRSCLKLRFLWRFSVELEIHTQVDSVLDGGKAGRLRVEPRALHALCDMPLKVVVDLLLIDIALTAL